MGQFEAHSGKKQFEIFVRLGVTRHDQLVALSDRQMHVEHLHRGELLEHGSGSEAAGELAQFAACNPETQNLGRPARRI